MCDNFEHFYQTDEVWSLYLSNVHPYNYLTHRLTGLGDLIDVTLVDDIPTKKLIWHAGTGVSTTLKIVHGSNTGGSKRGPHGPKN